MNNNMKHVNIYLYGRVQGVGFRYSAREKAREMGIKGFVKNKANGSVYIEAEGTENSLTHFEQWCKDGPSWSRVDNVEVEEGKLRDYKDFTIKH